MKRMMCVVMVGLLTTAAATEAQTTSSLWGQTSGYGGSQVDPYYPVQIQTVSDTPNFPPAELDRLMAPIALYPDVLIAQILPAATYPIEVVQAARWLRMNPDLSRAIEQPWDPSVIALCHYPAVLYRMDEDLDWTNAIGAAFLEDADAVMASIQRLRLQARATGVLQTTPQQTVVVEQQVVRIVPSQPNVVYVPQYNPQVVVVEQSRPSGLEVAAASAISFTAGFALGAWLDHDVDWVDRRVVYCEPGHWRGWSYRGVVTYGRSPYRTTRPAIQNTAYGHDRVWHRRHSYGRPVYTGRYSSFSRYSGRSTWVNQGSILSGNRINVNVGGTQIDRGYRSVDRDGRYTRTGGRYGQNSVVRRTGGTHSADRVSQRGATSRGESGATRTTSGRTTHSRTEATSGSGASRTAERSGGAAAGSRSRADAERASRRGQTSRTGQSSTGSSGTRDATGGRSRTGGSRGGTRPAERR